LTTMENQLQQERGPMEETSARTPLPEG